MKIEKYYWAPIQEVVHAIEDVCKKKEYTTILEIGPGAQPFSLATHTVGYNEQVDNYIEIDCDTTPLPFPDRSMDFMFSRHTFEDIQNPDYALRQVFRVCGAGFIETPSPLIEVIKGVDAGEHASLYGGYKHHRYIIWSDIEKCEIHILPKYSCIIDHVIHITDELYEIIKDPLQWNQYFIWFEQEPKIVMYKNGVNFGGATFTQDYCKILTEAITCSIKNTQYFKETFLHPL